MSKTSFVFTGGGTGGHVYPNVAIIEILRRDYPMAAFYYFGNPAGAERKIITSLPHEIDFVPVASAGLPMKLRSIRIVKPLLLMLAGAWKSYWKLRRLKPALVIGSGGYVSAPVILAARLLKLKVFLHEQNAVPGRMNQWMASFADRIALSFPSSLDYFDPGKAFYSDYPMRSAISTTQRRDRREIRERLGIPVDNKVVFVFGGSMGARTINRACAEIVPHILSREGLTLIWSTGRANTPEYRAYDESIKTLQEIGISCEIPGKLIIREYFDNIQDIYAVSDLVVARAGAGSVKEIVRMGIPALLVPKIDLPGDHQICNAREIASSGAAGIIYEEVVRRLGKNEIVLSETDLLARLDEMLSPRSLRSMKSALAKMEKVDAGAIIRRELIALLQRRAPEKEITTFYLQESAGENIHELVFKSTTFGNSMLADVYLPGAEKALLFSINLLARDEALVLKRIKGEVLLNGAEVKDWHELKESDRLSAAGREFVLKKHSESVPGINLERTFNRKVIGSSMGIIVSRIGGFFREVVTAALFGAGRAMDAFAVGLSIANLMRRVVAENALENAFMPIFLRLFHRSSRRRTWQSAASIINFTLLLSFVCTAAGILAAPYIIPILFPGFAAKGMTAETVRMTQLLFPYLFLVTMAAVMAAYLKAFNRFGIAEGSAVFFSIGSIIGILLLRPLSGSYALAYGVLLGGTMQIVFLYPFMARLLRTPELAFQHPPKISLSSTANKKYYAQLTPISLDVLLSKISEIVDKVLASGLAVGSISYLYYAMEIFRLPFAVISQAINTVILKDFSEQIALFNRERAKRLFLDGIRINVFLLLPISALMIILARPLVAVLLERSSFTAQATVNTALALQFYAIGLVGWGIHSLTTRIFAARLDIKTSLKMNVALVALNISLNVMLVRTSLGFAGLALGTSISFLLFALLRIIVLKKKLVQDDISISLHDLADSLIKSGLAALVMVIVVLESAMVFSRINMRPQFLYHLMLIISLAFIGATVYFLSSIIMKNSDVLVFRFGRKKKLKAAPLQQLPPALFLEQVARLPLPEAEQFRYKTSIYLASADWRIRNIGIKLIGVLADRKRVPLLRSMVSGSEKNGFIRRNALSSLAEFAVWDEPTRSLLQSALADAYYEVRVAALQYLRRHLPEQDLNQFRPILKRFLEKGNHEEKLNCLRLIQDKGDRDFLPGLQPFSIHANVLLREQLLETLRSFFRRGVISAEETRAWLDRVLLTSNSFQLEFRIKAIAASILREINKP